VTVPHHEAGERVVVVGQPLPELLEHAGLAVVG
jgi:hypothetical protein